MSRFRDDPAVTDPGYLNQRIGDIAAGRYIPLPGTVGWRLAEVRPCLCYGPRSLAVFARKALASEGIAWVMLLDASQDALSDSEADYVAGCFKVWVDGGSPFRKGARRVAQ
jgi:hypothetical protein